MAFLTTNVIVVLGLPATGRIADAALRRCRWAPVFLSEQATGLLCRNVKLLLKYGELKHLHFLGFGRNECDLAYQYLNEFLEDRPHGGLHYASLYALARLIRAKVIVETGVEKGLSTTVFLKATAPDGMVHSAKTPPTSQPRLSRPR